MQRIEVRTPFEQMAEALEQLAYAIAPDRVTFLWDRPVGIGEFVGFRIALSGGATILEGGGTCSELIDLGPEAPRAGRYRLVVTGLELDAPNARAHAAILERRRGRTASRAPEPRRPAPSVVPARPVSIPPPRLSSRPAAPASFPPERTTGSIARVFGRPSESPNGPDDPHDAPTVVAPRPSARPPSLRPSGAPTRQGSTAPGGYVVPKPPRVPSFAEEEPLDLLVPRTLVARAEKLLPLLAGTQGLPARELASPDTLLRHALRIGLAALEAQAEAAESASVED